MKKRLFSLALVFALILISIPAVFAQETAVDADIVGIEAEVFYDDSIDNDFGVLDLRNKEALVGIVFDPIEGYVTIQSSNFYEYGWSGLCTGLWLWFHSATGWSTTGRTWTVFLNASWSSLCYISFREYSRGCTRNNCDETQLGEQETEHGHSFSGSGRCMNQGRGRNGEYFVCMVGW
jgi:hypothetical protein